MYVVGITEKLIKKSTANLCKCIKANLPKNCSKFFFLLPTQILLWSSWSVHCHAAARSPLIYPQLERTLQVLQETLQGSLAGSV